jgi:hypothetical protein
MAVPTDDQSSTEPAANTTQSEASAALTAAGRAFCTRLANSTLNGSSPERTTPCDVWQRTAPDADLRWSVCSGSRLVGGLPVVNQTGEQLVEGPHEYVLKLELGTDQVPIARYGNHREALVWEQACERGVEHLFAPVIGHANNYRWLVMEETVVIGHDTWGGHGTPPRATHQQITALDDQPGQYEQALERAGLDFGASFFGQVGINRRDHLVALDYEHLHDATARTEPVWAGTYDPAQRVLITAVDAQDRNSRWRFRVLRWLANRW